MKNSSKVSLPTTTASSTDGRIALAWAWEFLRRNRCYRRDYRFSQRAPKIIRNDAIDLNAVTRKLSIRWFDVKPEPLPGDTLGSWFDRESSRLMVTSTNDAGGSAEGSPLAVRSMPKSSDYIGFGVIERLDPSHYWLTEWLDPERVTGHEWKSFYLDRFEMPEERAFCFRDPGHKRALIHDGPHPKDFETHLSFRATSPTEVALMFDLRLPIAAQLHQAEMQLRTAVEELLTEMPEEWHLIETKAKRLSQIEAWQQMLVLLDAREHVKTGMDAFRKVKGNPSLHTTDSDVKTLESQLRRGEELRDFRYQHLIIHGLALLLQDRVKVHREGGRP